MTNEEKELEEFRKWLRDQPMYVIPDHPLMNDQIDAAPGDYIENFCFDKKFSDKKTNKMFDWIALHNEVYMFLEDQGIRRKKE